MAVTTDRIAINPLQWQASADGWLDPALAPPLEQRLAVIRDAGLRGVQGATPPGMTPAQFARLLGDYGLVPAPGYISLHLPEAAADRVADREQVARLAEEQAALGQSVVFLAMGMRRDAARVARPAVGTDFRQDRLERVRDLLAGAAGIIRAAGVTPALHQHVGTWVETDAETRYILDTTPPDLLGFGPDLGHLAWAGADPAALIRDYAARVRGVHVKDIRGEIAARGKQAGWDYRMTVLAGLWIEPGLGTVGVDAALADLPASYDGWLVIEVDRGAQATPEESVRLCGTWARGRR